MNEEFILKLFEKFEKGTSVVLQIKEGETELVLKKQEAFPKNAKNSVPLQIANLPEQNEENAASSVPSQTTVDKNLIQVKSPIVGTFYRAPSPDSPPYVEKGSAVKKGQALCVLEAMKMMNTLEAEFDGVIEDIAVSNGDLVEFDQILFTIRVS